MRTIFLALILVFFSSCASDSVKVVRPTRIESHQTYVKPESINSKNVDKKKILTNQNLTKNPFISLLVIIGIQSVIILGLSLGYKSKNYLE